MRTYFKLNDSGSVTLNYTNEFGDRIYKSMPHNECVEKNCKKEYDDMDRIDSDKIKISCNKKYEKYKDQLKCYGGMTKAFNKAFTKYHNCKDTK